MGERQRERETERRLDALGHDMQRVLGRPENRKERKGSGYVLWWDVPLGQSLVIPVEESMDLQSLFQGSQHQLDIARLAVVSHQADAPDLHVTRHSEGGR